MTSPPLKFTLDEADRAHEAWGANCGPSALAAIAELSLEQVRPYLGDFEQKGYVNQPLMLACLDRLKGAHIIKTWRHFKTAGVHDMAWPRYGLACIQWEGPWLGPKVPFAARYKYTHWVAAARDPDVKIFDINNLNVGMGWVALTDWQRLIVPSITSSIQRADGKWHITHSVEVDR
jgi:hypothetical protein